MRAMDARSPHRWLGDKRLPVLRTSKVGSQFNKRTYRCAGAAAGDDPVIGVGESRTGNVEMGPRLAADELLKKKCSHDRSGLPARTDVLQIGNRRINQPTIFTGQGKPPRIFTGGFGGTEDLPTELVVVR